VRAPTQLHRGSPGPCDIIELLIDPGFIAEIQFTCSSASAAASLVGVNKDRMVAGPAEWVADIHCVHCRSDNGRSGVCVVKEVRPFFHVHGRWDSSAHELGQPREQLLRNLNYEGRTER
jgi:hypothetical protein